MCSVFLIACKGENNIINQEEKLKSGNLATDYDINLAITDIEDLNLNTVNIPIVIDIKDKTSNEICVVDWSMEKARELLTNLKGKNIKVILEAYPWISNGSVTETEYNPADVENFFYDWKNDVLNPIVQLANEFDVYAINISSNFNMLDKYEDKWLETIKFVRDKYKGQVTYKFSWWITASWDKTANKRYEDILDNKVLEAIDFVSIAAYFELSDNYRNSVKELEAALYSSKRHNRSQNIVSQIQEISEKSNKKIYFAELGFPRRKGAAIEPWNPYISDKESNLEQRNCFKAYKNVFQNKDFFKGFSVFSIGANEKHHLYYPADNTKKVIRNWD